MGFRGIGPFPSRRRSAGHGLRAGRFRAQSGRMMPAPPAPYVPGGTVVPGWIRFARRVTARVAAPVATLALASCVSSGLPKGAKLQNPVIFVPGMPGSVLKTSKSGEVLWGTFHIGFDQPKQDGGRLALPLLPGEAPRAEVVPVEVLGRMQIDFIGIQMEFQIYSSLVASMARLEPDPKRGKFFHSFAYDWRLDCAENARRLHRFMDLTEAQLRRDFPERFGRGERVRFDFVTHSMGALVTRYALCHGDVPLETALQRRGSAWASAGRCRKFIMVNPVNGGSLRAFERLIKGYSYGPLLPQWSAAMLGTLPSLYQLMPGESEAVSLSGQQPGSEPPQFDIDVWKRHRWGLFSPAVSEDVTWLLPGLSKAQRDAAVARHVAANLKRAKDFRAALEGSTRVPPNVEFDLLMGVERPTPRRTRFHVPTRVFRTTHLERGDGVVTLRSALDVPGLEPLPERGAATSRTWDSVYHGKWGHIVAMSSPTWIRRISRLLIDE
jgi:hypothetical protein